MARLNLRSIRWSTLVAIAAMAIGGAAAPADALDYRYGTTKPEYWFNPFEESAAQTVRAWFAAWQSGDPLLLGAFVDPKVIFRGSPGDPLRKGRQTLLRQVCGSLGQKRKLIDLFVIGGDYDTAVITRWEETTTRGQTFHMGSFFRVENGLIVEWYDTPDDAVAPTAGTFASNTEACQRLDTALQATG